MSFDFLYEKNGLGRVLPHSFFFGIISLWYFSKLQYALCRGKISVWSILEARLIFFLGGGNRINFFKFLFVCFQTNHVNKLILEKEPLRGGF